MVAPLPCFPGFVFCVEGFILRGSGCVLSFHVADQMSQHHGREPFMVSCPPCVGFPCLQGLFVDPSYSAAVCVFLCSLLIMETC